MIEDSALILMISEWASFNGGLTVPPLEKQIPRVRKKALGMAKLK
jgi:hypothetical protein